MREKQTCTLRPLSCSSPCLSPNHLTLSPLTLLPQSPNRPAPSSPSCFSPSARDIASTMSTLTQITSCPCSNHVCWISVKTLTFGGHRSHNPSPKVLPAPTSIPDTSLSRALCFYQTQLLQNVTPRWPPGPSPPGAHAPQRPSPH